MATAKNTAAAVSSMESFFERAALAQAPAWRPEVGEVLTGKILGFRLGTTTEYGEYPVIVVSGGENGAPVAFHAFHTIVRETLREHKPKKGDMLTVMYNGVRVVNGDEEKDPKDQKTYHLYYIEVGNAESTPVLDSIEF